MQFACPHDPIAWGLASTSQGRTLRPLTDAHPKSAIDDHGDFHHAMVGVCDLPPCAAHTARSRMPRTHGDPAHQASASFLSRKASRVPQALKGRFLKSARHIWRAPPISVNRWRSGCWRCNRIRLNASGQPSTCLSCKKSPAEAGQSGSTFLGEEGAISVRHGARGSNRAQKLRASFRGRMPRASSRWGVAAIQT